MKKSKVLCLLLSIVMLIGMTVPGTLALSLDSAVSGEACLECGQTEGHAENCSKVAPAPAACEECGQTEGHAENCSKVASVPTACEECGQTEGHAENCSKVAPAACEECGQTEGHAENCSKVAPAPVACEECGQTEGHAENCSKVAPAPVACEECGQTEGHAENCSKVAPAPAACEECGQTEGHAETCSKYDAPKCTCGAAEGETHTRECPLYVEPVDLNAELYKKLMAATSVAEVEALTGDMSEDAVAAFLASLTEEQYQALEAHLRELYASEPMEAPVTRVFTNAGPFMPAVTVSSARRSMRSYALKPSESEDNGLELSKVVRANADGSFTIRLEAYSTGTVTTSTKKVPVDIVLVLDQSGSMSYDFNGKSTSNKTATRQFAMKQAVNGFIGSVGDKFSEEADHRISIVTFGDKAETLMGWTFADATGVKSLQGRINKLPAFILDEATNIADGMVNAETLIRSGYSYAGKNTTRQKVVIVFTDGVPTKESDFDTTVATNAIESAKKIKDAGATVYTVGIFSGADPAQLHGDKFDRLWVRDDPCNGNIGEFWGYTNANAVVVGGDETIRGLDIAATNRFLNFLSSNFADASEIGIEAYSAGLIGGNAWRITKNFTRTSSHYYLTANDSTSLNEIFKTISENIQTANINLGSQTKVVDTVSKFFEIPAGTQRIKLYTAAAKKDGSFDKDRKAPESVTVTADGSSLTVTGFDFNANFVSTERKEDNTYGKKLVIEFDVVPRTGFLGGNQVPTNDWDKSAVYDKDGKEVEKFTDQSGTPTVDVPIGAVSVTAEDKNVYLLTGLTGEQMKSGAKVTIGGTGLNLTAQNFGLESWQNDYVDITVGIQDKNGATITKLDGLREDQTYSITVLVKPKYSGDTSKGTPVVQQPGSGSGKILVFKPQITWKDTVVDANQTPVYQDNFAGVKWIHLNGTTTTDSETVTMAVSAPTLNYLYDPAAAPISEDSFVSVTVKIGNADITNYVDFKHNCDCVLHTPCQWDDSVHGGAAGAEFIVHVNTFNLTITKQGTQGVDQAQGENQSYIFHVTNANTGFSLDVVICGDGSKTIANLPVGTYTVTEQKSWSWRYTAAPQTVTPQQIQNGSASVTFANTRDNGKWLNGGAYVHNLFGKLTAGN